MFKTNKALSKKHLVALSDALDEIKAHFEDFGFRSQEDNAESSQGAADVVSVDDSETLELSEDSDYEDFDDQDGYDREDIEVALDSFISSLNQSGLVKKNKKGKFPTFSEVFERSFGEENEISKLAASFENFIKGYFGWVSEDAMSSAFNDFVRIQKLIAQKLGGR